jgi:amino acid permease
MTTPPRKSIRPFLRKPLHRSSSNHHHQEYVHVSSDSSSAAAVNKKESPSGSALKETTTLTLERHLTLTDLIAIGIGGTIGSGYGMQRPHNT